MLEEVKTALRIRHNKLDAEIQGNIDGALAELARMGVSTEVLQTDDVLVTQAVKTYCKGCFASDTKLMDGYQESFKYQGENLRKSTGYKVGETDV